MLYFCRKSQFLTFQSGGITHSRQAKPKQSNNERTKIQHLQIKNIICTFAITKT